MSDHLVTWSEFGDLPEHTDLGERYELHDGEVVLVPMLRMRGLKVQTRLEGVLRGAAAARGVVRCCYPYRPAINLQYWVADVAFVPQDEWDALPLDEFPVYTPPVIVAMIANDVGRQRVVAMSGGTREF